MIHAMDNPAATLAGLRWIVLFQNDVLRFETPRAIQRAKDSLYYSLISRGFHKEYAYAVAYD